MDKPKKFLSDNVPKFFYEFDTEAPFENCSFCNDSLDRFDKYAVEKVFKQNKVLNKSEIVYEYAICWGCATEMGADISDDSRKAITQLFSEHNDNLLMKLEYLHSTEKYNIESWIERCSLTGKEIRLCDEFSVSGVIEGNKLVYEHSPMVVSDEFMKKLQGVLSKETKEAFDDLRDKMLDGTPSLEDLIFSPTPGLI
ncbi:MAG: hypothetical protein COA58_02115 [Bacteroidetes bacterium]|nr:MAG: hypothetical protein COA58_02115 [Bacteroidota bacterium]